MKKNIALSVCSVTLICCFVLNQASAQMAGGEVAAGVRLGGSTGATVKFYGGGNRSAIEVLGLWNFDKDVEGFGITALWEKLAPLSGNNRINAIIGGGPAMVFGDEFRFGLTGILGFDWRLKAPINLQVDWAPTWYFVNGSDFSGTNVAFSVRYVLNRKRK
jgi:hypothetical protein